MTDSLHELPLSRFDYHLPENNIAQKPLEVRDASRLLCYQNGQISHHHFQSLPNLLSENTCLVFNETKVIPARLIFTKESGARIEIFLIEPIQPEGGMEVNLASRDRVIWKAMVGNAKKWKLGQTLTGWAGSTQILAKWHDKENMMVLLRWDSGACFSEILEVVGKVPLPPYIHREAENSDKASYQTVYAQRQGAVAAPTAGLHFTSNVLNSLSEKGHQLSYLTLHVGAGTFQPVVHENVWDHPMHSEYFEVSVETIKTLQNAVHIAAVGTTSLRTLESLYWLAVWMEKSGEWHSHLNKTIPYTMSSTLTYSEAMRLLANYCEQHQLNALSAFTSIMIVPGYQFKSAHALITNFHMPKSTLIMLIEAFIGPAWKEVYEEAIRNDYRFLSYGDSSVLFRQ